MLQEECKENPVRRIQGFYDEGYRCSWEKLSFGKRMPDTVEIRF